MPRINKYYRYRIRNAADSADALVISSFPSDTNPYILVPPSGDGSSFDPLKGSLFTGSYTIRVKDKLTAANTRVVTAGLADAMARQQYLSRKGIVEGSPDGSAWTEVHSGYVNAVRALGGLVYEFANGDTQRKEVSTEVFKYATPTFPNTTAIIGGPIMMNTPGAQFAGIRDYGGWRYTVADVNGFGYVQMDIVSGMIFDPRKANASAEFRSLSTVSQALSDYTNSVARPHFEESAQWIGASIYGHFPGLEARVQTTAGVIVGYFTPLARRAPPALGFTFGTKNLIRTGLPSLYLNQDGLDINLDPLTWNPGLGESYDIYIYIKEISPDNPLHYTGHPVDLWQAVRDEAGIEYDSSTLAACKAAVGTDMRIELRPTHSYKIKDLDEQIIRGPFGLGVRYIGNGEAQLFPSRPRTTAVPTDTITVNDLREPGKPYEIEESTAIKRVVLKQIRLTPWTTEETSQPEADGLMAFPSTISIDNSDTDATVDAAGEIVFDIPGQITSSTGGLRKGAATTLRWLAGVADEIFDRWGRGIISVAFECLSNITFLIGDEVILDLPHLPVSVIGNAPVTQKGTETRIFQIVARTETPTGPNLKLLDAGSSTAASVVPTFTLAANATDGRKYVDVAITNGPAVAAIGGRIRVWVATGAGPASGSGLLALTLDPATADLTFTLPAFDAGTRVWVQMQSVITDGRPSALSAFQNVDLTDLNAPTGLAVSAQDAADPSRRTLTWTVGANASDIPIEVALRLTAEGVAANRVVVVLPPGSTTYTLTGLDAANRTASVRHRESPPFEGVSSYATVAVNTSGAMRTLNVPDDPRGFSTIDGTYGMDVEATEIPSEVEFQVQVGAGSFETIEIVTSVSGGRTVFTDTGADDGVTRTMRARHVKTGYTASGWTASVTAVPWTDDPIEDCPLVPLSEDSELLFDDDGDVLLEPYCA